VVSDSPKTVQELHRTLTESLIRDCESSEIDFFKGFDPGDGSRGVLDGGGQVALVVYDGKCQPSVMLVSNRRIVEQRPRYQQLRIPGQR
jgi:hypothetical protein